MNADEEEDESENYPQSPVINRFKEPPIKASIPIPGTPAHFSIAFSTGKGKVISVSAKALEAAKSKIKIAEEEEDKSNSDFKPESPKIERMMASTTLPKPFNSNASTNFPMFSTGGGKAICVSKKAVEEAKRKMVVDMDTVTDNKNDYKPPPPSLVNNKSFETQPAASSSDAAFGKFPMTFSTGGGKAISVSKKAIEEAKRKTAVDMDTATDEKNEYRPPSLVNNKSFETQPAASSSDAAFGKFPMTFSIGGGKVISVSSKALEEAKRKMTIDILTEKQGSDSDSNCKYHPPNNNRTYVEPQSKDSNANAASPLAFSTGKGKVISVSAKSLEEANLKIAKDTSTEMTGCDSDFKPRFPVPKSEVRKSDTASTFPLGFSTGGGKKISVSAKALAEAKIKIAEDNHREESEPDHRPKSPRISKVLSSPLSKYPSASGASNFPMGFSTGGGKAISVSAKAIEDAKRKIDADSLMLAKEKSDSDSVSSSQLTVNEMTIEHQPKASNSVVPSNFTVGFSTGGGKAISVSAKALQAAKSKLTVVDNVQEKKEEEQSDSESESLSPVLTRRMVPESQVSSSDAAGKFPMAFSTGGGKVVSVSSKALDEAKKKIATEPVTEESDSDSECLSPIIKRTSTVTLQSKVSNTDSAGHSYASTFSTTGGKIMSVSPRALEAAKRKLAVDRTPEKKCHFSAIPLSPKFTTPEKTVAIIGAGQVSGLSAEESMEVAEISRIFLDDTIVSDDENEWVNLQNPDALKQLRSVKSDATTVAVLKVVAVRTYPLLYTSTPTIGPRLFFNEKAFCQYDLVKAAKKEQLREKLLPEIEQKVRETFVPKPPKGKLKHADSMSMDELLGVICSTDDAMIDDVVKSLSLNKRGELEEAKIKLQDRIRVAVQQELQERMKASGVCDSTSNVLRVRVMDIDSYESNEVSVAARNAVVSIWKPKVDVIETLKETNVYEFQQLKYTGIQHDQALRFSTMKESQISPTDMCLKSTHYSRKYTPILEIISQLDKFKPPFGEFDTVGRVNEIGEYSENTGLFVYFADNNENILKIKFWNSLKSAGVEEEIKVGSVVACYNLEWRMSSPKVEAAFVQDVTIFTTQRKQDHLSEAFDALLSIKKGENGLVSATKTSTPKKTNETSATRTSSKRALLEHHNDEPPDLPPVINAGPAKRRRLSNSRFVPPRRVSPK